MPKNDGHSTQHKGHTTSHTPTRNQREPEQPAPDESAVLSHSMNDNPPEMEKQLRELIASQDFDGIGYLQQSPKNNFLRLQQFDATVTIQGVQYPCKVLLQLQMAREDAEQQAA